MSMYFSALEVARTLETGATVGILMVLVVDLFIVAWNRGAPLPPQTDQFSEVYPSNHSPSLRVLGFRQCACACSRVNPRVMVLSDLSSDGWKDLTIL